MKAVALVAVMLVLNEPLYAQATRVPPRGEPARPTASRGNGAEAQWVMNAYARCLVRRGRRGVERFLAVLPGSPDWSRLGSRIATPDCLYDAELRFQASIFRGALYEALYREDYATDSPAQFAATPVTSSTAVDPATLSEQERAWLALQNFGDCVVRAKPAEARALILSEVAGLEETEAFAMLNPALGPCLVQGVELRFSRPILRGLIAEGLYRLSAAAAEGAK